MPSKKKKSSSRIKARKGGGDNNSKKKVEQQGMPGAQMEWLKIDEDTKADDDALLEEAIKLAAVEKETLEAAAAEQEEQSKKLAERHGNGCDHGYVKTEDHFIIEQFAITFLFGFVTGGFGGTIGHALEAADKATKEKYPEVWEEPSKLKQVVCFFLWNGTQEVLKGDINDARIGAGIACYLEDYIATNLHKTKATMDATKVLELFSSDEHTLVKYLRKNIPCSCLDEKYKEVKSTTKMGLCRNPQCRMPDQMVERSKMLYCTRCRDANYCSPECQKAHWPMHKECCDKNKRARAALHSREQP